MNISGFHHIAFRTSNWDETMGFWRDGLGFAPRLEWGEAPKRAAMLDLGDGNYFEVFEREPSGQENVEEHEQSALHFCVRTDNCEAALQQAVAAGAQMTTPVTSVDFGGQIVPEAKIAFVKSPEGIVLEFFECEQL